MNEFDNTASPSEKSYEYDLRELFRLIWGGRWLIAFVTSGTTVIAAVVALMLPNIYRAEALLAPNQGDRPDGLAALATQFGGIASLAGLNFGSLSTDKTTFGLEVLQSRKFISEFIVQHGILVPLMAAGSWDTKSGEFTIDADDYDVAEGKWMRSVRSPRKKEPSLQEAYEKFMKILSVRQDRDSGFVTIGVEHLSPIFAKQWTDWLVHDINATVMQQDVTEANQAIEYLNQQIKSTPIAELQVVFFRLIEGQMKTVMLAKVSSEYLFKTVDPAVVPELKVKPRRAIILVIGFAVGLMLSIMLLLLVPAGLKRRISQ